MNIEFIYSDSKLESLIIADCSEFIYLIFPFPHLLIFIYCFACPRYCFACPRYCFACPRYCFACPRRL